MTNEKRKLKEEQILKGRYKILGFVGGGGQAEVYLAEDDENDGRKVIVKVLVYQFYSKTAREEELSLFTQEAKIFEKINHPQVPEFYDFFEEKGENFIAEEYIEGKSLDNIIHSMPEPFSSHTILDFLSRMLDLLHLLHGQNPPILVRDIKPANIIIDKSGTPYLIDFTIAREHKPGKKDTIRMGSPGYAPPEQYRGETDPRSDIYSLGATAYQMLTHFDPASRPFALPAIEEQNPKADRGLGRIIKKAVSIDPEDRYPDALSMKAEVDKAREEMNRRKAKPVPAGSHKLAVFAAIALLVSFLLYGAAYLLNRYNEKKQAAATNAVHCFTNLTRIASALEQYAGERQGNYPGSLQELVPEYLDAIPVCPEAGIDTYSPSYRVFERTVETNGTGEKAYKKEKAFIIYCRGYYHKSAGFEKDQPRLEKGKTPE